MGIQWIQWFCFIWVCWPFWLLSVGCRPPMPPGIPFGLHLAPPGIPFGLPSPGLPEGRRRDQKLVPAFLTLTATQKVSPIEPPVGGS